jgi:peptidoglycan/xylan/chitin deacetylase (PgdA/CDA1 family)
MYHRVLPRENTDPYLQPGMYVLPETLDMHLKFLNKHFFVWPLYRLKELSEKEKTTKNKICFITFDDGWLDFYDNAFPILRAYEAYATVFLPTGYIGTRKWFWTDKFIKLLGALDDKKIHVENEGDQKSKLENIVNTVKGSFAERAEKAINILKQQMKEEEIYKEICDIFEKYNINQNHDNRAFLNWEEVYELQKSGLIEFGSHTVNHKILTTLNNEEIRYEVKESKEVLIQNRLNSKNLIPFCYPGGIYDRYILEMVKSSGYDLAVTTQKGWNTNQTNPYSLRRVGIHQDMTSTKAMFACRIAGLI